MPDEKPSVDDLTKTLEDEITLTEADLNQVSGGAIDAYISFSTQQKVEDKT